MAGTGDWGSRKRSGPTSDSDTYPWIDEVTFALNRAVSNNGNTLKKSPERPASRTKREIPRLDLSRLFTRRKSSRPREPSSSPLPTPEPGSNDAESRSPQQVWQQITTNPWGIRIRKAKSPMAAELLDPNSNGLDHEDTGFPSPKIHVRKPPPGVKYWFDVVDEEDGASVRSDPEGRASLSSERSLLRHNRDTFLSISSGHSPATDSTAISTPVKDDSPTAKLGYFNITSTPTRPRSSTLSTSPTDPFTKPRPVSKRSHSSVSTIRAEGKWNSRTPTPPRQRHLPDPINKGESVLVLSETDDEDDEDDEDVDDDAENGSQYQDCVEDAAQRSPADIPRSAPDDVVVKLQYSPITDVVTERPMNRLDHISQTSIEEGSQVTDDHSPRTSLLSDLRPISFRSEYRPLSFNTVDRPFSFQSSNMSGAYHHRNSNAWLTSPTATASHATSPINLPTVLSEAFLPFSQNQGTRPDLDASKAQRIMVVTDEEARLLASIRRKRAEMRKEGANDEARRDTMLSPRPSSPRHLARPSTADPTSRTRSGTGDTASTVVVNGLDLASPIVSKNDVFQDRHLSSQQPEEPQRPSTGTVEKVWEDVQDWRKRPPTRRDSRPERPSLPKIQTSPPTAPAPHLRTHFSPASPSPRTRMGTAQRMKSDGAITDHLNAAFRNERQSAHKRRSQSLGDKLARRDGTDVKADVLAAWGDLGGWRRSAGRMSSPVGSPVG